MQRNDAVFVISVAARLVGMHANTLRKYENEALLRPARTSGNLRLYSNDDIARLRQIKILSEEHGVNVAGIRLALHVAQEVRRLRDDIVQDQALSQKVPEQQRNMTARLERILDQLELDS
ncbi:MAG: MerR family transcriptional regulator [Chloroflexota bacterium]|nr:MAG: MerR family transcriptional regulator [Chloroflexota bacterium]